ncbi:MAG TPA: DUF6310 domain-containing protein [Archangium sp.]|nr:DUF6310 domain-containing protein [Archangium sp.]
MLAGNKPHNKCADRLPNNSFPGAGRVSDDS